MAVPGFRARANVPAEGSAVDLADSGLADAKFMAGAEATGARAAEERLLRVTSGAWHALIELTRVAVTAWNAIVYKLGVPHCI